MLRNYADVKEGDVIEVYDTQAGRAQALVVTRSFVVLLHVHLHFPDSGSLKAKRAELNSVKAHLRQRMGASVAEVGHQDSWQRSTLAVALAGRLRERLRRRRRRDRARARRALPAGGPGGAAPGLVERPGSARVTGDRMRRVDEAVREVLSDAITKDIKDPRVGFVTVTAVETAPDLRRARVFVSVLGDGGVRKRSHAGAAVRPRHPAARGRARAAAQAHADARVRLRRHVRARHADRAS